MSRADELRARAARVTEHAARSPEMEQQGTAQQGTAPTAQPSVRVPRVAPVRITVDLDPTRHRRLKRWCGDTAELIQRPAVAGADVVRALLDELDEDADLATRIRARLQD